MNVIFQLIALACLLWLVYDKGRCDGVQACSDIVAKLNSKLMNDLKERIKRDQQINN